MQPKHISGIIFIFIVILFQSCTTSYRYSYEEENQPEFKGDFRQQTIIENEESYPTIKVVSFNIKFAQNIEEAIVLLQQEPLNTADVILLQEMDEKGTERLAKVLNMSYAYYPAVLHPKHGQNFGNAILSKWTITNSQKFKLPHSGKYLAPFEGKNYLMRRTATIANIDIRGESIAFASTHAAVFNTTEKRKEIAQAIVAQMQDSDVKCAVVGGDFNCLGSADVDATVGTFTSSDFLWASQFLGMTINEIKPILSIIPKDAFQLDHLFVKGMCINDAGKVDQEGVSDHLPIWADLEIERDIATPKKDISK